MSADGWTLSLLVALVVNALTGTAYRIYRLRLGGPRADLMGQAMLSVLLLAVAGGVAAGAAWARWAALAYGLLFGVVAMPLWILAVFIPLRPGPIDRAYAVVYWVLLGVVVVAALAAG